MNIESMFHDYHHVYPHSISLNKSRLKLIPLTNEILKTYLNDLWDYSSNPSFYEFLEFQPFDSINQCEEYFISTLDKIDKKQGMLWLIILAESNKAIGTIRLAYWDLTKSITKIGYGISPDYTRKGYYFEALSCVVKYAFEKLQFYRIESWTNSENIGSIKGLEKLGFCYEGCLRKKNLKYDGTRHDVKIFSMIKDIDYK
tara:strand:- start:204 stop:803 length:600 start_codon:yes stop_codon:yes gene_type:complete